jgi:hypothetical protein
LYRRNPASYQRDSKSALVHGSTSKSERWFQGLIRVLGLTGTASSFLR